MPETKQIVMSEAEIEKLIKLTVHNTLTQTGIDSADPIEMQKDFVHLRKWRESTDAAKKKGIVTAIGFIVLALLGTLGAMLKDFIG